VFTTWEGAGAVLEGFTVTNGAGEFFGGGIHIVDACPTVADNIITGNQAQLGGGISCQGAYCIPTIIRNKIVDNHTAGYSYQYGGGIHCEYSFPVLTDNIIAGNTAADKGGGLYCIYGEPVLTNNTLTKNSAVYGGGVHCHNADCVVTNCILWDNDAITGPQIYLLGNLDFTISYSDVEGGEALVYKNNYVNLVWGDGMKSEYPFFVDPNAGDWHLRYDSPCRNTGSDLASFLSALDFEGDPRVADDIPDMGADEFHRHLYSVGSVVPGGAVKLRVVGEPALPVKLGLGSGVLYPPKPTGYGDLYLVAPFQQFELGSIPANGVLLVDATAPPTWKTGEEKPFQALVDSDLTNLLVITIE